MRRYEFRVRGLGSTLMVLIILVLIGCATQRSEQACGATAEGSESIQRSPQ
jgi:hypothetical protein